MPELVAWQRAHDYPFEFSTEASVNLADDHALLEMMAEANFFAVFVGIESPDPDSLVAMKKKQNTRRILPRAFTRFTAPGYSSPQASSSASTARRRRWRKR